MHRAATALLVAAMTGLSACGDDDGVAGQGGGATTTGEQGPRAALVAFTDAMVEQRFADVCAVVSDAAKQQLKEQTKTLGDCEDAVRQVRGYLDADDVEGYKQQAREAGITVRGNKATVAPFEGDNDPSFLIRQGNRWLVDANPEPDTTSGTSTSQEQE